MNERRWRMGLVDGGICIDLGEYNPALNKELKAALPGPARWDRTNGWWVFPLHWDTCVNAREVANDWDAKIKIAPALVAWANAEKDRRAAIPDVQSMDLVDLPRVRSAYPGIWGAVSSRPFQTVGAAFAARNHSCLIADQPGLGKTLQTIAAIVESGVVGPIFVCAPKAAAKLTWPKEIRHWLGEDELVFQIGSDLKPAERKATIRQIADWANDHNRDETQRVWVLTSPNYVRIRAEVDDWGKYKKGPDGKKIINPVGEALMGFFDITWSAVVVDESHQTLAGASGDKKKQSAQRLGLGALDVADNGLRIALSGTPFRGKEEYLWGQLNWLRPDLYRSRWRWIKQWFHHSQGQYGMLIGGISDRAGMYEQAATVMIRRTKAEVAPDLPPKMYAGEPLLVATGEREMPVPPEDFAEWDDDRKAQWYEDEVAKLGPVAVWLDMDEKQKKAYDQIKQKAEAEIDGGTLMTVGVLSEITRLKQFAGSYGRMHLDEFIPTLPSNKYDWVLNWLDERNIDKSVVDMSEENRKELPKVIIASQFSSLINAFEEGLKNEKIDCFKFTGETGPDERQRIVDSWQDNPNSCVRVLLMTTTAGGTGITLDAADDLITLDDTWDVSAMEQLEDRIHRLSRMHQVNIWALRSLGTIEEGIARANLERDTSIKEIIDGSRGVPASHILSMAGGK